MYDIASLVQRDLSFSMDLEALFIKGITAYFLTKLIAIEFVAKNTYSKVSGLLGNKFNTLALTKFLISKSRILYQ